MSYYLRAFCKFDRIPTIAEIEAYLKEDYPGIRLETDDPRDSRWTNIECFYKEGNLPIVVECNTNDGPDSLAAEECAEFIELIGSPGFSLSKRKVINHLKNTKYIISCQLLSDIDEEGFNLNGVFLNIFSQKYGGVIQADEEGFYNGHKVIVKI